MKITQERLHDFISELNERTDKALAKAVPPNGIGYHEIEGVRWALKTRNMCVYNLNDVERVFSDFVDDTIEDLLSYDIVVKRREWKIRYVHPTHICPYTFDYVETPREGYWVLDGRFRGIKNSEIQLGKLQRNLREEAQF